MRPAGRTGRGKGGKLHGDHWDKFSERDASCAWIIGGAVQSWMPGRDYEVKDMCMVTQRSDALFIAVSKGGRSGEGNEGDFSSAWATKL